MSTAIPFWTGTKKMQIEAGKFYVTSDGRKTGPMIDSGAGRYFIASNWHYAPDGTCCLYGVSDNDPVPRENLVAEWHDPEPKPQGPTRTRLVTEIVYGTYGVVNVGEAGATTVLVGIEYGFHDAATLRAAAAVLVELADALGGGAK